MWIDDPHALWRALALGSIAYFLLILFLRVGGKRTLAKLNAFDFVVTVAIGSILANILTSTSLSLAQGVLALAALVGLQALISWLSVRSGRFQQAIRARPRFLVRNGEIDDAALADERVTRGDLLQVIRTGGFARIEDVGAVVLEADGHFNVLSSEACARQPLTALEDVAR
ncbi:DUF421 domain-containing protein [Sphingomicrobium astaxanthinifaciens]|uniref:DUF421 domain-containing protein n=1 Tax=Sphingomicrobium astaxanthinifaciens TaxID=1227949 RepID=UPI001FCB4662|nr:YetF domain-containing protein [Sphingomicrobium astaxanthinifaciens]MCJ7421920.1 DUF421 domain-containing protein [Sphingomicrobium astaxanthinifaciens]